MRISSSTSLLSDTKLLALAIACFVVAMAVSVQETVVAPHAWVLLVVLVLVGVALRFRSIRLTFVLVIVAVALRSSIEVVEFQPVLEAPYSGLVEVMSEPESVGVAGLRMTLKLLDGEFEGSRVEAVANGQIAWNLFRTEVGDQLSVDGRLSATDRSSFRKASHIEGTLRVSDAGNVVSVGLSQRVPQALRSQVDRVSDSLSFDNQALFSGLVVGDDSEQDLSERSVFAAAGLTHLLAVSGQNVAFVLLILRPVLRSLPIRSRTALALTALVVFALVTRLEPSVLRAVTMTSISLWGTLVGRKTQGLKALSLAVIVLLIIDPFLSLSIGFQLSVVASLGILLISPALRVATSSRLLAGLSEALAVTVGAQVAVAPLLAIYFGAGSVISFPANLAAGWVAGLIMGLGVASSLAAPFLPEFGIETVGWFIDLGIDYLQAVATLSLRLRGFGLGFVVLGLLGFVCVSRSKPLGRLLTVTGLGLVVITILGLLTSSPMPEVFALHQTSSGTVLWVGDSVRQSDVSWLVTSSLEADIVVSESGSRLVSEQLQAIEALVDPDLLFAPSQHSIPGANRVLDPISLSPASGEFIVSEHSGKLVIDANPAEAS